MKTTKVVSVVALISGGVFACVWLWSSRSPTLVHGPSSKQTTVAEAPPVDSVYDAMLPPIGIMNNLDLSDLFGIVGIVPPQAEHDTVFTLPKLANVRFRLVAKKLRLEFRAPDGTRIVPGDTHDLPGYQYIGDELLAVFRYEDPPPGLWTITASNASSDSLPYLVTVGSTDPLREKAQLEFVTGDKGPANILRAYTGDRVFVRVFVSRGYDLVPGVRWTLTLVRSDRILETIAVYDDGFHSDGQPNDGVSVGSFSVDHKDGVYDVVGTGRGPSGHEYGVGGMVGAWQYHDLVIDGDVLVNPTEPTAERPVTLTTTVTNAGRVDSSEVVLHLLVNGERVSKQRLTLDAGASAQVPTIWTPGAPGSYDLRLVVDPFGRIREKSYKNNAKTVRVNVRGR